MPLGLGKLLVDERATTIFPGALLKSDEPYRLRPRRTPWQRLRRVSSTRARRARGGSVPTWRSSWRSPISRTCLAAIECIGRESEAHKTIYGMSRSVSELKSSEPSAGLNRWGAFLDRFEAISLLGQTPTAEVESSLGHAARLFWFLLRQIPRHLKLAGPHPRCLSDISPSELSVRHRETFNPIRSRKDKGQWLLFHKGWF